MSLVSKINIDFNSLNGCSIPAPEEFYVANGEHASFENLQYVQEALKKLYEYERLEEQELLIKLPCKLGSTVYELIKLCELCDGEGCSGCKAPMTIHESKFVYMDEYNLFGKTVFLTREEAEKALERLEKENDIR